MADSCVNIPTVKYRPYGANQDVEEESKLFLDLRSKFPRNRQKQVRLWNLANNPKFKEFAMSYYPDYFENGKGLTSQGEINLATLLSLIGEDKMVYEEAFLSKLMDTTGTDREFDATQFPMTEAGYAEGINQVIRFNSKSDYRREYKAQLVAEYGAYKIQLVKWKALKKEDKTRFAEDSINSTRRNEVKYKIMRLMAQSGMHARYVDDMMDEIIQVEDPLNRDMSALEQGYRAYVGVLEGSTDAHFMILAGRFTILSLGQNDSNVNRLKSILSLSANQDYVNEILHEISQKDPDFYSRVATQTGQEGHINRIELVLCYIVGQSLQNHEKLINKIPILGSFWRLLQTTLRNIEIRWNKFRQNQERVKELQAEKLLDSNLAREMAKAFYKGEYGNAVESLNVVLNETVKSYIEPMVTEATTSRMRLKDMIKNLKSPYVSWKDFSDFDDQLTLITEMSSYNIEARGDKEKIALLDEMARVVLLLEDQNDGLCNEQLIQDIRNTRRFGDSMQVFGDKIKAAKEITRTMLEILKVMDFERDMRDPNTDPELKEKYSEIISRLNKDQETINDVGEIITCRFLSEVIGSDYVMVTLGKKWWNGKQQLKDLGIETAETSGVVALGRDPKRGRTKVMVPIDVLLNQSKDIDAVTRSIVSMGRVQDTTLQMIDIYNRKRQGQVREKTMARERRLSEIYKYAKEHGVDIDDFFERENDNDKEKSKEKLSEHNKLTGNFIMPECMDKYDRDLDVFKRSCWEKYKAQLNESGTEDNAQWSLNNRYLWEIFWKDQLEKWNAGRLDGIARGESIKITLPNGKKKYMTRPSSMTHRRFNKSAVEYKDYTNHRYDRLFGWEGGRTPQQEANYKVYRDLMDLKMEIDNDCLESGSTRWYRAPQFKGGQLEEIRHRGTFVGAVGTMAKHPFRRFLEDADRYEFGDDRYNDGGNAEFDPFMTEAQVERHKMDRIPMYGINKLQNMNELSTNLWRTMRAYSFMAENYKATRDVINTLELYHDIVNENSSKRSDVVSPNKVAKLNQYFEDNFYGMGAKQIYLSNINAANAINGKIRSLDRALGTNISNSIVVKPTTAIVTSVVKTLNNFTAFIFLGFNYTSAGINFISGNLRLATEAIKGEKFTYWELTSAVGLWMIHKLNFILWEGKTLAVDSIKNKSFTRPRYLTPPDKYELFMRKCDTSNDYQKNVSRVVPQGATEAIRDLSMLGYEWSDDFMSSVGYVAAALHTKLIDKDGNKRGPNGIRYNVWNTLKVIEGKDGDYMLDFEPGKVYFKSDSKRRRYLFAEEVERELQELINSQEGPNEEARRGNVNTKEYARYLNSKLEESERQFRTMAPPETQGMFKRMFNDTNALYWYLASENVFTLEKEGLGRINENSKFNLAKMQSALKKYKAEQAFGDRDFAEIEYEGRMTNLYMHGVYNQTDRSPFQKSIVGSMISTMKGYAFGYFMREFIGTRIDIGNGKRLSVEEYMEKYYPEILDDPNFGTDAKLVTKLITGQISEVNELIDVIEMRDVYNVTILDTDQIEGTLLTSIKTLLNPRLWPVVAGAGITAMVNMIPIAGFVLGPKMRDLYMNNFMLNSKQDEVDTNKDRKMWAMEELTEEHKANILRTMGNTMFILILGMLRTIVGATLPPEDENEEDYAERLNNLIKNIAAHAADGKLTDEEKKLAKVLASISPDGKTEAQYMFALREAIQPFVPQYEAKPTLKGLLYFCLAGSEIENMAWNPFYPRMMVSEMQNITKMLPPMFSMLLMMYNNMSLTKDTLHGEKLMGQVNDELEKYRAGGRSFEFIKKEPNDYQIAAMLMLQNYYNSNKDDRHMILPDINSDEFFNVNIMGLDMSKITLEDKKKVRTACYNFMKEIWGKDESVLVKGNDGSFALNRESATVGKLGNAMNEIKTGGAALLTGSNEELSTKVMDEALDDPLRNTESKWLINRFYYGSAGYGHKKYDQKYLKNWMSISPIRSLKPMAEAKTGIKNRLYFYIGRR